MDSDNSEGEADRRELVNRLRTNHACDDTSDVSDDENISHAARSIESPPESPQEAGHFESPPASPESDLHRNVETPSTPRSPDDDAGEPRSPDEPSQSPGNSRPMRGPHSPDQDEPQSPADHGRGGPRSPDDGDGDHSLDFRPRSPDYDVHSPASASKSPPPASPSPPLSPNSPPPPATHSSKRLSDSNSDISSNSSFGLPSRRTSVDEQSSSAAPIPPNVDAKSPAQPDPKPELKDHAEDLSDVSDLGSLDSVSEDEGDKDTPVVEKKLENGERSNSPKDEDAAALVATQKSNKESGGGGGGLESLEDAEALDFEPGEEREEGECGGGAEGAERSVGGGKGSGGGKGPASDDEGELKEGDELEEGELTDEGDVRPEETEPRPICRFYNRGQCTWGSNCRFVHPGVPDKGNYTMFEMVRPLVPVNGPQGGLYSSMDYRPIDRPMNAAVYQQARKEELPVVESAWERGLRQAKEMLRKSSKRKETEVDFEEKKMNLTLSQDELDKENDLYLTRSASPIITDEPERRVPKAVEGEGKRYRTMTERFDDYGGGAEFAYGGGGGHGGYGGRDGGWGGAHAHARAPVHYDSHEYHHPHPHSQPHPHAHHHQSSSRKYSHHSSYAHAPPHPHHRSAPAPSQAPPPASDYYPEPKRHKRYPPREVIVQRLDKSSNWKDDSPPPSRSSRRAERGGSGERGRGDEWADPWMRSKSPAGTRKGVRTRKQSYTSASSYSSSSSSPSSRSSSYSSFSRDSRSRSRSSRSRSRSRRPVPVSPSASRRLLKAATSPFTRAVVTERSSGKVMSPAVLSEKWAVTEKARHMNPPPPSPRTVKPAPGRGPTSPAVLQRNPTPPSDRPARQLAHSKAAKAVAAAMRSARSRSKSATSHSSSQSDSTGSSSDSSESSLSSSSSSRGPSPSPPTRPKRIVIDDRLAIAQAMKVKAMDALKLSGQKQQIKLTLKGGTNPDRPVPTATMAGKKRPLSSPTFTDEGSPPKGGNARSALAKKTAPSRREELLKQLKAVEDAIARKRSKIL